jgi:peroxin-1
LFSPLEFLLVQLDAVLKKKSLKDQYQLLKGLEKEVALLSKEITVALSGCDFMLESAPQIMVEEEQWAHESRKEFLVELICRLERPLVLISSISDLPSKITNNTIARSAFKASRSLEKFFLAQLSLTDGTNTSNFINWESIRGLEYAKQALLETIIWPIKYQKLYSVNQFERPGGVLLHGPSGCGKTMLMTALATVGGFKTIIVRGPELIGKYIGTSEAAIRDVFKEARKHRPTVICFDELDALAPRRGNDITGVTDRVVNQLLTEIDGTTDRSGVFVVATSSRPEAIDPALLRSGRIERMVEIGLPEAEGRAEIIESLSAEHYTAVDVERMAKATANFTAAQIKGLLYDAHLEALSDGKDLSVEDIASLAMRRAAPGPKRKGPQVGQKATFA